MKNSPLGKSAGAANRPVDDVNIAGPSTPQSIPATTQGASASAPANFAAGARQRSLAGMPARPGSRSVDAAASHKRPWAATFDLASVSPATATAPAATPAAHGAAELDPSKAAKFIVEHLHSQVLADLTHELDKNFSRWAFTGSVALNIHAVELEGKMARPFHDADILVNKEQHQAFVMKQKSNGANPAFINPGAPGGDPTHYTYKGMLVDILCPQTLRTKIEPQIEVISGIPVRALNYLVDSKTSDQCNRMEPANAPKATTDLQHLTRLTGIKNTLAAPAPTPDPLPSVAIPASPLPNLDDQASPDGPTPRKVRRVLDF